MNHLLKNIDLEQPEKWNHIISLEFNQFNEMNITSINRSQIYNKIIKNVLCENKLGLSFQDIDQDKKFVKLIWDKSEEIKASIEKKSKDHDLREELWALCLKIKECMKTSQVMSGVKKKSIAEHLETIEFLLKDESTADYILEEKKKLLENYQII